MDIITLIDDRNIDELKKLVLRDNFRENYEKTIKGMDEKHAILLKIYLNFYDITNEKSFFKLNEPWELLSGHHLDFYDIEENWLDESRLKNLTDRVIYSNLALAGFERFESLPTHFINHYEQINDNDCRFHRRLIFRAIKTPSYFKFFLDYLSVKKFTYYKTKDYAFWEKYCYSYKFEKKVPEVLEFESKYDLLTLMCEYEELIEKNWGEWVAKEFKDNYLNIKLSIPVAKKILKDFPELKDHLMLNLIYLTDEYILFNVFDYDIANDIIEIAKKNI